MSEARLINPDHLCKNKPDLLRFLFATLVILSHSFAMAGGTMRLFSRRRWVPGLALLLSIRAFDTLLPAQSFSESYLIYVLAFAAHTHWENIARKGGLSPGVYSYAWQERRAA